MSTDIDKDYELYTTSREVEHGYEVKCTKGLFSVIAPTKEQAHQEARHYFYQYYSDGEYS